MGAELNTLIQRTTYTFCHTKCERYQNPNQYALHQHSTRVETL